MMTEYHPNYESPRSHEYDDHGHSNQQNQQMQQQPPQIRSSTLERGRSVRLMRNGDSFFTGRGFVINQRKYPLLDAFMDDASQALRANFGAVRCIYTPNNGTRLRDISQLEDHQTYVAGGGEKFKKLHYLDIAEGKRVQNRERGPQRLPPMRRYDVEGRAMKLSRSENMIIYVYRNGDPLTLPSKILLVKATLQNWESVLDEITRKVSLSSTAVLKLYAMNGELITSAQQLEYNGMYVAAGKERFKRIDYPDPKSFSPNSSPKMSRKSSNYQFSGDQSPPRIPPIRQRRLENDYEPFERSPADMIPSRQYRYAKSDGTNTNTTANSHGSVDHIGQRRPVREEYDFFSSKPQQHRRGPTKEIDLDRDDGGIYKGRVNHRDRVREVDDTRETKVEVPVDFREVETVDDENLYGQSSRTPRRPVPPGNPPKTNQGIANSRQQSPPLRPIKSPPKRYDHDDEHRNGDRSPMANHDTLNPRQRIPPINGLKDDHRSPSPPAASHSRAPNSRTNDDRDDDRQNKPQPQTPRTDRSNKSDEDQAATVIQSHVRGYLTRKQIHDKSPTDTDRSMKPSHHQADRSPSPPPNARQKQQQRDDTPPPRHKNDDDDDDDDQRKQRRPPQAHAAAPKSQDEILRHVAELLVQQTIDDALKADDQREEITAQKRDDGDDDNV